jgi:predicted ribosome quality control (RQC) complex YloA/Tae2 family protein
MKTFILDNYTCKLGENATENWKMVDNVTDSFYFFHLSSFPSGYVILECDDEPPLHVIQDAAQICKQGTKYRNLKNINVDYCPCSNITKSDKVGEVIFKSQRKVKQVKI